jgi:hypothetical protein
MATQSPPAALQVVDDVMWDPGTPEELQLICYYSMTWSNHDEAKPLIKKAAQHSHETIRADASGRSSSE